MKEIRSRENACNASTRHLEAFTYAYFLVEPWHVQEGLSSRTTAGRMDES